MKLSEQALLPGLNAAGLIPLAVVAFIVWLMHRRGPGDLAGDRVHRARRHRRRHDPRPGHLEPPVATQRRVPALKGTIR